jgi:hypothetical protein
MAEKFLVSWKPYLMENNSLHRFVSELLHDRATTGAGLFYLVLGANSSWKLAISATTE